MFPDKVKVLVLCVAVAAIFAAAPRATADKKKEPPRDEKKILGTWVLVSGLDGGKKAPEERIKGARLIIAAGGKMTVENADGKVVKGTYKLDPSTSPKQFTVTNDKGQERSGIYKLDGDTLTVCYDRSGGPPTEFASKEGTSVVLEVLKREKK
jgi:uncharacterized protein (TIGR03067 family)